MIEDKELREHKELSPSYQTLKDVPAELRKAVDRREVGKRFEEVYECRSNAS